MRLPGLAKDRKAKNGVDVVDSYMNRPATSEAPVRRCLCVNCGKVFSEPVQLTVHGKGSADEYSACPHCFSRVSSSEYMERSFDQSIPEDSGTGSEETEETAAVVEGAKPDGCGCGHFVGYLKTLSKGAQFPEECLTCASLIKCKY